MAAVSDTSDQSTFHWYNPFSWFVSDGEAVGDAAVDIANIDLDFKRVNRARSDALTKQGDPNLNSVRDQRPDPADAFKQADDAANVVKTGAMIAITIEASAGEFASSAPDTGGGFGSAARTEANGVKKGGQAGENAAEKVAKKVPRVPENPATAPGPDWTWRGKPGEPIGGDKGAWFNPKTGETMHPDLSHGGTIGPHWDWRDQDGNFWRLFPDGRIEPRD